jgi:molybdopterin synthase catalytic subunit
MIRVQEADFDVGKELSQLTQGNHAIGGLAVFVGLVRDHVGTKGSYGGSGGGTEINAMTLEHYPAMTEKMLAEIEAEARKRWPLEATLVIHRFGRLEPGDRIVMVAAASAHRQAAFEACEFLMDWLKTKAPFWKLEESQAGALWVDARESDTAAAARWVKRDPDAAE